MKRLAYAGIGAVLALTVVTGCSDDDGDDGKKESAAASVEDAPKDASSEDFCTAMAALTDATQGEEEKPFRDALESLAEVGTPAGVADEARTGFEVFVTALDELAWSDRSNIDRLDGDDEAAATAFVTAFSKVCAEQLSTE